MKLVNSATGAEITTGSVMHDVTGSDKKVWRFVKLIGTHPDNARVHCTTTHARLGRIHKEFSPHVFGATVTLDVALYADRAALSRTIHSAAFNVINMIIGGFVAWMCAEFCIRMFG